MFSKSQFKLINSLGLKKYRGRHQLFLVEGKKAIDELLGSSLELYALFTTEDIFEVEAGKTFLIGEGDLKRISNLTTPQTALAIFHMPRVAHPEVKGLMLALDSVQDPGNLGTIIRMCDWFGIEHLICSEGSVDAYNPKVVQATMGSIARVHVHVLDLPEFLRTARETLPVYGAFLGGENLYAQQRLREGVIVMGNEANGISRAVEALVTQKLVIPQFGLHHSAESLNVATATAIFLSEFSRGEVTGR